jgi:hypothetical protein
LGHRRQRGDSFLLLPHAGVCGFLGCGSALSCLRGFFATHLAHYHSLHFGVDDLEFAFVDLQFLDWCWAEACRASQPLFEVTRRLLERNEFARLRLALGMLGKDAQLFGAIRMALDDAEAQLVPGA